MILGIVSAASLGSLANFSGSISLMQMQVIDGNHDGSFLPSIWAYDLIANYIRLILPIVRCLIVLIPVDTSSPSDLLCSSARPDREDRVHVLVLMISRVLQPDYVYSIHTSFLQRRGLKQPPTSIAPAASSQSMYCCFVRALPPP